MSDDGLALGILLAEPAMERWAVEAVETAIRTADVSVEQVILPIESESAASNRWKRYATSVFEYGAWTPVLAWHRLVTAPDYLEKVPIENLAWLDDADRVRTRTEPADGIGRRFPDSTVDRIAAADLDVLFRRGFGILEGDVLRTPTHGVLSYHHGNVREYRGRPPAVWEFAHDERTAGITLQRLTPTLDGGEIVVEREIDIADHPTWQAVERALFEASTDMLATACTRLADPAFEPRPPDELGPLYTEPGVVETVRIEFKTATGTVLDRIRS
ncbi:formyltransferase family protein [Halosolutus halophilus]|uniref:formyltransferase family protein n=1 Tax=Halosolutus halophilus TaxID=1552990 RepID=UPI002235032B|nr:formyltransferase family protein [Halosolutus halophilus]